MVFPFPGGAGGPAAANSPAGRAVRDCRSLVRAMSRKGGHFLLVVGAFFIDFTNALLITVFLNIFR